MAVLEGRYRVRDIDDFMGVFADFRPVRVEMGVTACRLMCDADDPTKVVVMFDLPSIDAAKAFAADPRRQDALRRAGVTECQDVFLDQVKAAAPL
jgi:hypothetical protein